MKQTNTERAGARAVRAAVAGGRVRGGRRRRRRLGKKPRKQKRGDGATSNDPRIRPPSTDRAARRGSRAASWEKEEDGTETERDSRGREGAPRTTTLDSYNCSFLQIPGFLPPGPAGVR